MNDGLEWRVVSPDTGTRNGAGHRIICNIGMAMPWLPVAVTAQVIMGTVYVYSTKASTASWILWGCCGLACHNVQYVVKGLGSQSQFSSGSPSRARHSDLPTYLSIYLSMYLSIYLYIYLSIQI